MKKKLSPSERFWSKVNKTDSCWEWTGGFSGKYGEFWLGNSNISAHRASWILTNGDIVANRCVCHTCDNTRCVRPSHLFLGTKGDNNKDRSAKGRSSKGVDRPAHKLTEQQVLEIRELYKTGEFRYFQLAATYNVTKNTIGQLVRGETWKHV